MVEQSDQYKKNVNNDTDLWDLKQINFKQYLENIPKEGNHILAQFNNKYVVVYQAFNNQIADFAVQNQFFGGPHYSFSRMSWVKTNFLWMMYRSGWAQKSNQERILALWIEKDIFENQILKNAYSVERQKNEKLQTSDIQIRLQWDPDHDPYGKSQNRRAIQLGMKGEALKQFGTQQVKKIVDITNFVNNQYNQIIKGQKDLDDLIVAEEYIYEVQDQEIAKNIHLKQIN